MDDSNGILLRRFLAQLPYQSSYAFSPDTRKLIRKALVLAVTDNGNFIDYFLPWDEDNKLEKVADVDWRMLGYYTSTPHTCHASSYHGKQPCSRIFRKGEPVFRCLTCGIDETCALCGHCFIPELHKGHKIHIAITNLDNGGICDCGDPEAWLRDLKCPYSKNDFEAHYNNFELPEQMILNFSNTISILLDYVIDIMSQSNLQFLDHDIDVKLISDNCNLDPANYGGVIDHNSTKFSLVLHNDQTRHYRDAVQRIHLASKKVKQFAEMVTAKVHHYGKAKVLTSNNISILKERQKVLSATGLATSIRSDRDLFREEMCDEILNWIIDFTNCEIFKFNERIKKSFTIVFLQKWKVGLQPSSEISNYKYSVGTLGPNFEIPKLSTQNNRTDPKSSHWNFEPLKWDLPESVTLECEYNLSESDYVSSSHLGSRLQYLLYLDIRFWKSIRVSLNAMLDSKIVTNLNYKTIVAAQFFDIYPTLADIFLNADKEPESSMIHSMSMQLFTSPSNSALIINHGGIPQLFAVIYSYLNSETVKSPNDINVNQQISMKSLKNGRWSRLLADMNYLFLKGHDASTILTGGIIPITCDILALFQGKPVMIREQENHIEYESPDYTAFFNTVPVVYNFGKYIASSLTNLKSDSLLVKKEISGDLICYVIEFLLKLDNREYPGLIDADTDIDFSDRRFLKDLIGGHLIWDYNSDTLKVSFLHPLHSFLSILIELSYFESQEEFDGVFLRAIKHRESENQPSPLSLIFEYPVRTIALMAQIRSGFWVRNGFTVRNQLHLYRNTGVREYGYLRDLFLVQIFVSTGDPNLTCFLIFNRWMLMNGWIRGDLSNGPHYDPKILPYMLEECVNFFLHILTEDLYLRGLSAIQVVEKSIQRELIHSLCFGPMPYSKLCSQIPDHITNDKKFDHTLHDIAIYSAPKSSNDTGIYTLKEKYMDKVNPYYFNYSTNTRDECIKLIKDRARIKTGKESDEIYIQPIVSCGPDIRIHKYTGNFSISPYFADFIIRTLQFVISENVANGDSLIEATLHLIHACSMEQSINLKACGSFYSAFIQSSDQFGVSIAQVLHDSLSQIALKKHHSKIRSIFNEMQGKYLDLFNNLIIAIPNFDPVNLSCDPLQKSDETESERKKRIAKERQSKLLSKFKKQQSLFLKNNTDSEYSDAEMDECNNEKGWKFPEAHCILCQNASEDSGPFGITTYISKSSEFRNIPFDDKYWFMKAFSDCGELGSKTHGDSCTDCDTCEIKSENWRSYIKKHENNNVIGPGFSHADQVESRLLSLSCGHGMHFRCYLNFLANNKSKQNQITRNAPENSEHNEFLCPLCKSLNNMFVPVMWSMDTRRLSDYLSPSQDSRLFDYLTQDLIKDSNWTQNFYNSAKMDYEKHVELTNSSRHILMTQDVEESSDQLQFLQMLSEMHQTLSILTFPQAVKMDCTQLLANTIRSTEIALRGSDRDVLVIHQLSNNTMTNLRVLNEFCNTVALMKIKGWSFVEDSKTEMLLKTLAGILTLSSESFNNSIFYNDFFDILVSILPIPSFQLSFNTLLHRCFLGHLIQTLNVIVRELSSRDYYNGEDYNFFDLPTLSVVDEEYATYAAQAFKAIRRQKNSACLEESVLHDHRFGKVIYSLLVKACTPFLRRATILSFVQCSVVDSFASNELEIHSEADKLCSWMQVCSIGQFLALFVSSGNAAETRAFQTFVNYLGSYNDKDYVKLLRTVEYPGVISLCQLPDRLDLFFSKYYCTKNKKHPQTFIEDPAVCLFCGVIVDAQKGSIGCSEGQCTTHFLKDCPNNVGIFMLPKSRTLLLLHRNGGTFHNIPYLDQHGELPSDLKKNKALYLMKPRYEDFIKNVWLLHNVPNLIVRNLDSVVDAGGWDTL